MLTISNLRIMILAFYLLLFPRSDGTMDIKAIIDMAIKTATMLNYGNVKFILFLHFYFQKILRCFTTAPLSGASPCDRKYNERKWLITYTCNWGDKFLC